MYTVVGCRNCRFLWSVEGRPDTTQCPRCRSRYRFAKLRSFGETETSAAAARIRSAILANRAEDGEFIDPEEIDTDAVGMDDDEFLTASGIDADAVAGAKQRAETSTTRSRSRKQIVLDGLETLEQPTLDELTAYAAESGVSASYVETAVEKLTQAGEILRTNDGYRQV